MSQPITRELLPCDQCSVQCPLTTFPPLRLFFFLLLQPNRLPRCRLNRQPSGAPVGIRVSPVQPLIFPKGAYRRNNLTIGLHVTTPGVGIPSSGGLHEYCVISNSGHSFRSIGCPLRRFSSKFLLTIFIRSGRDSTVCFWTRGAIVSRLGMLKVARKVEVR